MGKDPGASAAAQAYPSRSWKLSSGIWAFCSQRCPKKARREDGGNPHFHQNAPPGAPACGRAPKLATWTSKSPCFSPHFPNPGRCGRLKMQSTLQATVGRTRLRGAGLGRSRDLRRPPAPRIREGPQPAFPPPGRRRIKLGSFSRDPKGRPDRDARLPQGPSSPHTGGFPSGRGGSGTFI